MFCYCYVSLSWNIELIQSVKLDSELPWHGAFDSEFKTSLLKHAYVEISYVISDLCDVTQSSLMLYLYLSQVQATHRFVLLPLQTWHEINKKAIA